MLSVVQGRTLLLGESIRTLETWGSAVPVPDEESDAAEWRRESGWAVEGGRRRKRWSGWALDRSRRPVRLGDGRDHRRKGERNHQIAARLHGGVCIELLTEVGAVVFVADQVHGEAQGQHDQDRPDTLAQIHGECES